MFILENIKAALAATNLHDSSRTLQSLPKINNKINCLLALLKLLFLTRHLFNVQYETIFL